MLEFIFNKSSLSVGAVFSQPKPEDFPNKSFKYAGYNYILENVTDYVRQVVMACPAVSGRRDQIVVDVKVHDIQPGKYPCLPGWHCDTVINPFHDSRPEIHHIFVSGEASLTEFIEGPVCLQIDETLSDNALLKSFREQLDASVATRRIPSCQIMTYGRFDFHRGTIGQFAQKRLLIRVTESDIIKPHNTAYTPTTV